MTPLLMKQCADTAHVQKPGLVCFTKKQNFVISKKKIKTTKKSGHSYTIINNDRLLPLKIRVKIDLVTSSL